MFLVRKHRVVLVRKLGVSLSVSGQETQGCLTVFVLIEAPQKNNSTRGGNVQNKNEFICVHMARGPEWRLN